MRIVKFNRPRDDERGDSLTRIIRSLFSATEKAQNAADSAQSAADSAADRINNMSTGNENLVVNGGFTGFFKSESVLAALQVEEGTELWSDPFGRWDAHDGCTAVTSLVGVTGMACQMAESGQLWQAIARGIIQGSDYTFSVLGVTEGSLMISIGGHTESIGISTGERTIIHFTADSEDNVLLISGVGTFTEVQLVIGNITVNDWTPSPEDNSRDFSYFKDYAYLLNAIGNASTTTLGGLILTQMIRVGNYADKQMTEETGGMSGVMVNPESPFLWGGGTMQQAIATIMKYANNPTYQPTAEEVNGMAKFVVTHGGRAILNDIILRGLVYATGGKFTGKDGLYRIELNADDRSFSVYGPDRVKAMDDLTPKEGATEVQYLKIGDFRATVGSAAQGYMVAPDISMIDAAGITRLKINTYNGVVMERDITSGEHAGTTQTTFLSPGVFYNDITNFTMILKGLPTSSQGLEVGQVYVDNGTLKIKTS